MKIRVIEGKHFARLLTGAAFLSLPFFISGCVATSSELSYLRDDIYQLQLKLNEVQKNQADIATKMDELNVNLKSSTYELEDTQNKMSVLGQRLDDVESNLSQRMTKLLEQLSGAPVKISPPPSELYKTAYGDFSRGRYDLALTGFKNYIDNYPSGESADQARYYIGECYYSSSDWRSAIKEFDAVEASYPKSSMVPASRLKKGLALELIGSRSQAKGVFESIVKDFPASSEAFTAKEKLASPHATDD